METASRAPSSKPSPSDWTVGTSGATGRRGELSSTTGSWTDDSSAVCSAQARLYCFEH